MLDARSTGRQRATSTTPHRVHPSTKSTGAVHSNPRSSNDMGNMRVQMKRLGTQDVAGTRGKEANQRASARPDSFLSLPGARNLFSRMPSRIGAIRYCAA